jgi:predicted porin
MEKKDCAPLLTALALMACAPAQAQSELNVYGIVDVGLVRESDAPKGSVTNLNSGIASGSRLGFKGSENLGGGIKASFVLENGFNADTGAAGQGGLLFGRQSYVGLSGGFGALTLGRQYSPYYKALRDVGDPFGAVNLAGRAGNIMATNTRVDNTVEYVTPNTAGLQADLAYVAGETAGDSAASRALSGALAYARGSLRVQLARHQLNNASATDRTTNTLLAASYDAGALILHAAVAGNKGTGAADSRDLVAGVTVPFGADRLLLSRVRHADRTLAAQDATQWGIGFFHARSPRTDLYAAYASILNRHGAAFKVGNATDKGTGSKAANLGVRHSF